MLWDKYKTYCGDVKSSITASIQFGRGSIFTKAVLTMCFAAIITFGLQCLPVTKEGVGATVKFDWDFTKETNPNEMPEFRVVYNRSTLSLKSSETISSTISRKVIKGKEYREYSSRIVPVGSKCAKGRVLFVMQFHREIQKQPIIDIYLSTNIRLELQIENYGDGKLKEVSTGKILRKPFILLPGKYHLQTIN